MGYRSLWRIITFVGGVTYDLPLSSLGDGCMCVYRVMPLMFMFSHAYLTHTRTHTHTQSR